MRYNLFTKKDHHGPEGSEDSVSIGLIWIRRSAEGTPHFGCVIWAVGEEPRKSEAPSAVGGVWGHLAEGACETLERSAR